MATYQLSSDNGTTITLSSSPSQVYQLDGSLRGVQGPVGTIAKRVVTLTPGTLVATDADTTDLALLSPVQNFTLSNPTGTPIDGQMIVWRITQDSVGSRTITLDTDFSLGAGLSSVTLSTTPNKTDYLGVQYDAAASKWQVIALQLGY